MVDGSARTPLAVIDSGAGKPLPLQDPRLVRLLKLLLNKKRWRLLRYMHAREGMLLAGPVQSVLVVGAGYGLAEIALALEWPNTTFHLTDHGGATHDFDAARDLADRLGLTNVTFGQLDILSPAQAGERWDMVMSIEVLEHLLDDWRAAEGMMQRARRYVFTLVPYATQATNADPVARRRALEKAEHVRVGYDAAMLNMLFPGAGVTRGCYWLDAGHPMRLRLDSMTNDEMAAHFDALLVEAATDLRDQIPAPREALGIWRLSDLTGNLGASG